MHHLAEPCLETVVPPTFFVDPAHITWRRIGEEIIILDLDRSVYLSLNGTGALLWEALVQGTDEEGLTHLLTHTFGVDSDTAAGDVAAFVARCTSLGLLR